MDTINQSVAATTTRDYWVEMAESLEKLEKNKYFKKVILEGYFKDKAVAGVSILANDQVKQSGVRTDVMEGLVAISALQDHFKVIKMMGKAIQEEEEVIEEEEDANNTTYNIED